MRRTIVLIPLFAIALLITSRSEAGNITPLQLSLFPPVQLFPTNYDVYGLRLNLLYGKSHDIYGVDIGTVFGGVDGEMVGIQLGVMGSKSKSMEGVQVALFNIVGMSFPPKGGDMFYPPPNQMTGLQVGLFNITAELTGLQVGLFNQAGGGPMIPRQTPTHLTVGRPERTFFYGIERPRDLMLLADPAAVGNMKGVQLGVINGAGILHGVQLGTFASEANECYGIQVAGFINSANSISGCQIGTFINGAGYMSGVQIALENVAVDACGLQIGIINIAAKMKGVQIGVFNYIRENPLPFMVLINASF